jgi:uncharacterized membrane protein
MISTILILILLALIICALGTSLYFLIRDRGKGKRTVKALIWRLVFTLALIALLVLGYYTGWIHPHHTHEYH